MYTARSLPHVDLADHGDHRLVAREIPRIEGGVQFIAFGQEGAGHRTGGPLVHRHLLPRQIVDGHHDVADDVVRQQIIASRHRRRRPGRGRRAAAHRCPPTPAAASPHAASSGRRRQADARWPVPPVLRRRGCGRPALGAARQAADCGCAGSKRRPPASTNTRAATPITGLLIISVRLLGSARSSTCASAIRVGDSR